jgi:hypothetical protein
LPVLQDNLDDPTVETKGPGCWLRRVEEVGIERVICDVNNWLFRRGEINMKNL